MKIQIPDFANLQNRLLVIGDVMLDRYWYGQTSRISPEAPVPVVHVQSMEEKPGGAGNVALNLCALDCQPTLLGCIGDDLAAASLLAKLQAANVDCQLQTIVDLPTVTKLRVLSQHQQLIRLDFEEQFHDIDDTTLLQTYHKLLPTMQAVVLSDYGKGVLTSTAELIAAAKHHQLPVLVDPKGKDFSLYRGATLLTPNRKEFEVVVGSCRDDHELLTKGQQALQQYDLEAILITRGAQGMTLIRREHAPLHLPAHAKEVFDVTGAGDTVIATFAAALAAGESMEAAMYLANWAASIVVGKIGAATASIPELHTAMFNDNIMGKGIVSEEQLLTIRRALSANGKKVVMTNGCFDILHAGHVAYLQQAKQLGDHLIVAVNDDASVVMNKGVGRPINNLACRMAVLAGLDAVDWVVPFSEKTPQRLIESILPDVLVKGGDYKVADIAGADAVLANNGEVKLMDFIDGLSTTNMLQQIRAENCEV